MHIELGDARTQLFSTVTPYEAVRNCVAAAARYWSGVAWSGVGWGGDRESVSAERPIAALAGWYGTELSSAQPNCTNTHTAYIHSHTSIHTLAHTLPLSPPYIAPLTLSTPSLTLSLSLSLFSSLVTPSSSFSSPSSRCSLFIFCLVWLFFSPLSAASLFLSRSVSFSFFLSPFPPSGRLPCLS